MKPLIKSLYIRLTARPAKIVCQDALSNAFRYRTMGGQLSFNFRANQKFCDGEEKIYKFIVRHEIE